MISLIFATSENGVIGKNGSLPWDLPDDLKHFRDLTRGKTVIMGSKTYESIGHPLPKRRNIIISRDQNYQVEGCEVVHSPQEALELAQNDGEIMIIGGATIYEAFLPLADRVYLTRVHTQIEGDTFFTFDESKWQLTEQIDHPTDEQHQYAFSFLTYVRKAS